MTHSDNASPSNQSVAGTSHHVQPGQHHPKMGKVAPSSSTADLKTGCFEIVREYQRGVKFRVGKLVRGPKGPGMCFVMPCIESFFIVDARTASFDIPKQLILTKDSLTVVVDAVVFYRIYDPVLAITKIENYTTSTQLLASTMIRHTLGTRTLADILADQPGIAKATREALDDATDPWGVKVERVEIKNIILPVELHNSMAAEGEATRQAKAKIVAAEGEFKASEALKEAGNVLRSSEGASKLRQLLMIDRVGSKYNTTVMVPIGFMNSK
ncbi:unnamed protein product [Orchesella dallaii]|uniref:Band 7 domain-containing protein n=1 Tax=Orchesella dallaii TaxID=48710 RepID=A0ABP1Q3M7_9HEXA